MVDTSLRLRNAVPVADSPLLKILCLMLDKNREFAIETREAVASLMLLQVQA